jgi:hypothetical protein
MFYSLTTVSSSTCLGMAFVIGLVLGPWHGCFGAGRCCLVVSGDFFVAILLGRVCIGIRYEECDIWDIRGLKAYHFFFMGLHRVGSCHFLKVWYLNKFEENEIHKSKNCFSQD